MEVIEVRCYFSWSSPVLSGLVFLITGNCLTTGFFFLNSMDFFQYFFFFIYHWAVYIQWVFFFFIQRVFFFFIIGVLLFNRLPLFSGYFTVFLLSFIALGRIPPCIKRKKNIHFHPFLFENRGKQKYITENKAHIYLFRVLSTVPTNHEMQKWPRLKLNLMYASCHDYTWNTFDRCVWWWRRGAAGQEQLSTCPCVAYLRSLEEQVPLTL